MTAEDVYTAALALIFEDEQTAGDYKTFSPALINLLLPGLFSVNNAIREVRGKEPLTELPRVSAFTDEIPYEDDLVIGAMPYGLAEKLVYDDMDMDKVGYFNSQYVNAVNALTQVKPQDIEDVYA